MKWNSFLKTLYKSRELKKKNFGTEKVLNHHRTYARKNVKGGSKDSPYENFCHEMINKIFPTEAIRFVSIMTSIIT